MRNFQRMPLDQTDFVIIGLIVLLLIGIGIATVKIESQMHETCPTVVLPPPVHPCGDAVGVWTTDGDAKELVAYICPKGVRP